MQRIGGERREHDDIIEAVEELRSEALADVVHDCLLAFGCATMHD